MYISKNERRFNVNSSIHYFHIKTKIENIITGIRFNNKKNNQKIKHGGK